MKVAFYILFFCLFAAFSITVKNKLREDKSPIESLKLGEPMAEFTLPDRAGNSVTFGKTAPEAKVTMINFWASWCGPCRLEMPGFEKMYADKKKNGLEILAINEDEKQADLDDYLQKKPVSFPVLIDKDGTLAKKLGIHAFPTTILVGHDGKIIQVIEGVQPYLDYEIESQLSPKDETKGSTPVIKINVQSNQGTKK